MMSVVLRSKPRRGFTLIELLVVVLILAILMAVALPLYLSSVADSQKKTCRSNMQTIANAVQANRVKNIASTYWTGTVNASAVGTGPLSDLQAPPVCPTGGTYQVITTDPGNLKDGAGNTVAIPTGGFAVTCTNHNAFIPGVTAN